MAYLVTLAEPVTSGEQHMLKHLEKVLPSDWLIVGNPTITRNRVSRELDAIVIGDRCVWVVDEKGFTGRITGDIHIWTLPDGKSIKGVLDKIQGAARLLKGKIVKEVPNMTDVWIESLVLLSSSKARLNVDDERTSRLVLHLADSESYFLGTTARGAKRLTHEMRLAILRCIAGDLLVQELLNKSELPTLVRSARSSFSRRPSVKSTVDSEGVVVCIEGKGSFRRTYYSDIDLDTNELRGLCSKEALVPLKGCRLRIRIRDGSVSICSQGGAVEVRAGKHLLSPGEWLAVARGTIELRLGNVELRATIADCLSMTTRV